MELDANIPLIRFTVLDELIQNVRNTSGDALYVQGISPQALSTIVNLEKRPFRIKRFYTNQKLLIITIPTALHESLHGPLFSEITGIIRDMGLKNDWMENGATTHRARGHPGGDGGEGDSTGFPLSQRKEYDPWPTLVIEVGYSQSLQQLRNDMMWWFSASNHDVKIVLLLKMDITKGCVYLEKYQEVAPSQLRGARRTRSLHNLEPICTQNIEITRRGGNADITDPSSFIITRGALRLEFDLLFLRQPGVGEHDVIIQIPDLQIIASKIWRRAVSEGHSLPS
ncbi:hypothetical protein HJFPF1_01924 [Paramyrothecium foliicola]|nr:hypothetical protein HJFPF1_01924 [Paramyrothecium foliicola]